MPLQIMQRFTVTERPGEQPASFVLCKRTHPRFPYVTWRMNDIVRGGDGGRYFGKYFTNDLNAALDLYDRIFDRDDIGRDQRNPYPKPNACQHMADYCHMLVRKTAELHRAETYALEAEWYALQAQLKR